MAMTLQQIFDTVASHLLKQGARSLGEENLKCAYRGKDGRMCAVGVLIKDEFYDPGLEKKSVRDDDVQQALVNSGVLEGGGIIDESRISLLRLLQMVHDDCWPPDWKRVMRNISPQFQLDSSLVD